MLSISLVNVESQTLSNSSTLEGEKLSHNEIQGEKIVGAQS
jgi:hypothetical protein